MLLPPFRWGRGAHVSTGSRIALLRAVIKVAQNIDGYRARLEHAGLSTAEQLATARDAEAVLASIAPISLTQYLNLFSMRRPAWRQRPDGWETRSALMLPYPAARAGVGTCVSEPPFSVDLYSPTGMAKATADLYRLSRAIQSPASIDWRSDHALVVFSGIDAGVITDAQRDGLWAKYQVPLFEQFLGTDGRVIASECELHAGLHLRLEDAMIESVDGELVLTSLTDLQAPAIRVRTGLGGIINTEACDCGRVEPRLAGVRHLALPRTAVAVA